MVVEVMSELYDLSYELRATLYDSRFHCISERSVAQYEPQWMTNGTKIVQPRIKFKPWCQITNSPFVFPYISYRSSGEKLLKYQ